MFIETSSNDFYMATFTFTPKLEPLAAWMQFLGFPLLFWYLQYPSLCLSTTPNAWNEGKNSDYNQSLEKMNVQLESVTET